MPITVKHSGNAAPAAVGEYAAGQGKRYAEDSRLAIGRINARQEAEKARAFAATEAERNRQFQAGQNDEARQFRSDELDTMNRERDIQREKDRQFAWDQAGAARQAENEQRGMDNQAATQRMFTENDIRRDNVQYEFTAKQRMEYNLISDKIAEVQQSDHFTEQQKKDAIWQLELKQKGIQPVGSLKPPEPTLDGHKAGEQFTSPDGSAMLTVEADGRGGMKIKKLYETNKNPTWKDRLDARKVFVEQFKDKYGMVDSPAVEKAMAEMFAAPESEKPSEFSFSDPKQARVRFDNAMAEVAKAMPKVKSADEAIKTAETALKDGPATGADIPKVANDADFKALPSGSIFIAPDGTKRRKP
jgi:hypothetical protein